MRIEFEFSGGYGGLFVRRPLAVRVNTEDLPADKRNELTALVQSSGVLEIEPTRPDAPPGAQRDVFIYRLSIRHGDLSKSFAFDDATAPAGVHPLLAFLRQLAIEEQGKRT